jgi:hypothetical protein
LFYLKYVLRFRAICTGFAFLAALGVTAVKHQTATLPFVYVIFDVIFSVLMVPTIFFSGWRMAAFHTLASATWLIAAWQIAGIVVRHSA